MYRRVALMSSPSRLLKGKCMRMCRMPAKPCAAPQYLVDRHEYTRGHFAVEFARPEASTASTMGPWQCVWIDSKPRQCVFWTKFLQVFGIWHAKTCTKMNYMSLDKARFRCWHVVRLVKEKTARQIGTLIIEMTRTTRHVTLRWHFGRKCRWQLTFILCFLKTSRDTLDLKLTVKWNLSNIHTEPNPTN
jgi:hypothetical protein